MNTSQKAQTHKYPFDWPFIYSQDIFPSEWLLSCKEPKVRKSREVSEVIWLSCNRNGQRFVWCHDHYWGDTFTRSFAYFDM